MVLPSDTILLKVCFSLPKIYFIDYITVQLLNHELLFYENIP